MKLKERILEQARELGFAAAGIAVAGPAPGFDIFMKWLAAGHGAGMDYLGRHAELREDPRRLATGARSIIVVAARYPVNEQPGRGFSTYARGADYHRVLRDNLSRLASFLRAETPLTMARICVDSAPLPERAWALQAGVGWQGHQGQIVNERFGCCSFLGELLVDVDLEPTPPVPNRCGDCHRCIDACPTGAILPDGQLDCSRCLSYLTVEHRGDIPPDLQPQMGETLFGCDRCTAVCPWNRAGNDGVMPEFRGRTMPEPEECLAMTADAFAGRFRDSTVMRTGLDRLRRNAEIVMRQRP